MDNSGIELLKLELQAVTCLLLDVQQDCIAAVKQRDSFASILNNIATNHPTLLDFETMDEVAKIMKEIRPNVKRQY